jgi:acyl CoA:acetate/3-ketoacid CoA transferase
VSRIVPVLTAAEAVKLVPSGATVSVSSSSGLGCPDAVLAALGARFTADGEGGDLTLLHPIAAGDMYGIDGIDHLTSPGQIKRVIVGSYPSGPSSATPPKIVTLIETARSRLTTSVRHPVPTASRVRWQPGVLTEVGKDTPDPRRNGGRMNATTTEDIVRSSTSTREWLYLRSIPVDVASSGPRPQTSSAI